MSDRIPLLLIPGLLLTADLWRDQMADLADVADMTVADHTSQDDIAAVASAILAKAPDRFALAGLSFGGYLSFEIMRQAPERVTALALLDTSARGDGPEQAKRRQDFIALAEKGRFLGVTEGLIKTFIHPDRHDDADLMGRLKSMAADVGPRAFIRQEKAILSRPDSMAGLREIACPTLVLCGRQDALTPLERHEEIAEAIPNADLVVLARCGHLAPMERSDAVSDAMRAWLARI
jgi:pimeloyl-ACP methyl ester carboxylesterase